MQINVAQLLKEPAGSHRHYTVDESNGTSGYPIKGEIDLLRINRSILVGGTLHTKGGCVCSRCLDEFDCELDFHIEEEYFPTVDVSTGLPLSLPADDLHFTISADHILDLGEAFRQYTLLATPMKPVCREDCAGLCSQCGTNLNYGSCQCSTKPSDSRWTRLENLVIANALEKQHRGK